MDQQQQPGARAEAGNVAAETLVRELTSLAVIFGVSWALLHRDYVTRLWMRIKHRPMSDAEAAEHRAMAEFRREWSADEHARDRAPKVAGDGLYGGR